MSGEGEGRTREIERLADVLGALAAYCPTPTPLLVLFAFARLHAESRDLSDLLWKEMDRRRDAVSARHRPTGLGWPSDADRSRL